MKRRRFIESTALLGSATLFFKQTAAASTNILPTQFVAIGNGACRVMDEMKALRPELAMIKAYGVDYDFEQSTLLGIPILKGQPIMTVLQPLIEGNNPLLVLYCLGGKSNAAATLDFFSKLNEKGRQFKLVLQFPFEFEGKNRYKCAIEVADQISLITSFRSVHVNGNNAGHEDLKYNFDLLNKRIVNLILEEVK